MVICCRPKRGPFLTKGVEMDVRLSLIRPHSIFALERHSIRRPCFILPRHNKKYERSNPSPIVKAIILLGRENCLFIHKKLIPSGRAHFLCGPAGCRSAKEFLIDVTVQHSSAYQKTEKVLAQFTALVRPGMLTPGRDGAREAWQCHKLVLLLHKFNDSLLN